MALGFSVMFKATGSRGEMGRAAHAAHRGSKLRGFVGVERRSHLVVKTRRPARWWRIGRPAQTERGSSDWSTYLSVEPGFAFILVFLKRNKEH